MTEFFHHNIGSVSESSTLWSAHKAFSRGILLQLLHKTNRQRTRHIDTLTDQIKQLESQNQTSPSHDLNRKLLTLRQELRSHLLVKYKNNLKKSRAQFYATSNKAGKLLSAKLKGQRIRDKIHSIMYPSTGESLQDPRDIANAFSTYYSSLYNLLPNPDMNLSSDTINTFLNSIDLPTLTAEQITNLNSPFTAEEVSKTIDSLPLGKSPGPDGFINEYYKLLKTTLAPHLSDVFNEATSLSAFPNEMLRATIITLPKPGKTPNTPQNFRPISLLNTDVKIYAKTLANRLIPILPLLVYKDQSGFTKGRQSADATRRLIDLIHSAAQSGTPSLLLSLDAEKAFDRVHWGYLNEVLKKFGFGGRILSVILALYSCPLAQVQIDQFLSTPFNITNGTRQGCPLSPLFSTWKLNPWPKKYGQTPLSQVSKSALKNTASASLLMT